VRLVAVVLCRYDSSRLPGKILMPLAGRPVIDWILDRLAHHLPPTDIVVATSAEVSDEPIAEYCERRSVSCFRGEKLDVASRFVSAARAHGADFAVRVNGDNVLGDAGAMSRALAAVRLGEWDLITNVPGRTYGRGLSVEIVRVAALEGLLPTLTADEREHVTLGLYNRLPAGRVRVLEREPPLSSDANFALDTSDDAERIRTALVLLPDYPVGHDAGHFLELVEGRT
jgi:spore coat polysaccharide biosynthesis protein SpsF